MADGIGVARIEERCRFGCLRQGCAIQGLSTPAAQSTEHVSASVQGLVLSVRHSTGITVAEISAGQLNDGAAVAPPRQK
jgi:hypothetical protein